MRARSGLLGVLLLALLGPASLAKAPQSTHPGDRFFSNLPLGAIYAPTATTFRVFAPTATRVLLHIYAAPAGGPGRSQEMMRNPDGTWEATLAGDMRGTYYAYSAAGQDPGFHPERELPDPYAECVTACDGRALVVSDQTPVAPRPNFPPQDAIIYELHLRDYTIDPDSGVQQRGKYLGLTESGTRLWGHPEIKTGLDHLTELGVNTVQILPIAEFASDEAHDVYGWGYDAALYRTPDGWYASQRWDASRVRETKLMVDALHRRGLRVVVDMVLNHTEDGLRQKAGALEGLVPGYYYRRRPDGSYYNGSGCGNEIRSEAPMARRLIKDSLKHWVQEYRVDGFRLDLMGLMDAETMRELTQELHALDPQLLIYGEPWVAGETPIEVTAKGSQKNLGYAVFNDIFRDALKGSVFHPQEKGFVQGADGQEEAVRRGIAGSLDDFAAQPVETINYVECHDNHTLWDRLQLSAAVPPSQREAMGRLAAAILFTSQGLPFIQSGQEMLRTKDGEDNSYNRPDALNMIRWRQKLVHRQMVDYYAGLIALRRAHPMFRLARADQVRSSLHFLPDLPPRTVAFVLEDGSGRDPWRRSLVVFNASASSLQLPLPPGRWSVFVDATAAGNQPLASGTSNKLLIIPSRTAMVLGEINNKYKTQSDL